MNAWSGTVTRVESGRTYVELRKVRGFEVEALVLSGLLVTAGTRVLAVEYDGPDQYAIVGTLP